MSKLENQVTEGVIWKQILKFFFPILIGSFFQNFYTIVDAIIVGRGLGTAELAAVAGSPAKLIALITNFFVGISVGITAHAARSFGANDYKKLKATLFHGLILFLALALLIIFPSFLFSHEFLEAMGTPEDLFHLSDTYLKTYLSGIFFCVIYNLLSGILRALGDAKSPLNVLIFCCFINIFLDILLALVLKQGVFGVALATVIAQLVSAITLTIILFKKLSNTEKYQWKFDLNLLKTIALLGITAGIQSILTSCSNIVVQSTVNSLDTIAIAAWASYLKIDIIGDSVLSSLSSTVITFVGQNLGVGNLERAKESVKQTLILASFMLLSIISFFILNDTFFLSLFTTDPEVVKVAESVLISVMPMYFFTIPQYILSQALRAMGISFLPMMLGLFGSVVLRLSWVYFVFPMNPTISFLGLSYPVISTIMSVLFTILYLKELKVIDKTMTKN